MSLAERVPQVNKNWSRELGQRLFKRTGA
jgi:hypothetical protein